MEEWRSISGFDGYEVSDHGRVRSIKRNGYKILKSRPLTTIKYDHAVYPLKPSGTRITSVGINFAGKTHQVHRLVLLAFRGPCPLGMEGCHNDGDAANNKLTNLRWDTHEANMEDMIRHQGRIRRWDRPLRGSQLASAYMCGIAGLI